MLPCSSKYIEPVFFVDKTAMQLVAIAKKYIKRLPDLQAEFEQIETDITVADYFGYPADTRQIEELVAEIRNSLRPLKSLHRAIVSEIEAHFRPRYCIRIDLCCGEQMISDDEYQLNCRVCGQVKEIIIPTKLQPRVSRRCYEQIIYFNEECVCIRTFNFQCAPPRDVINTVIPYLN